MTWFQERRLDFIDWCLATAGSVRRADISGAFDVGIVQASVDLREFDKAHPGAMRYDKSGKAYVPARTPYRARRSMDWAKAFGLARERAPQNG